MPQLFQLAARSVAEARQQASAVVGYQPADDRTFGPYRDLSAATRVAEENLWGPMLISYYGDQRICWAVALGRERTQPEPSRPALETSTTRALVKRAKRGEYRSV